MDKLALPAVLDSLSRLRAYAKEAAAGAGIDDQRSYQLQLAVDEIATNIITHGYEEQGLTGEIVVALDQTDRELTVILEDTGVAFDPRDRSLPTAEDLEKPLDDREIGGLGIFLALAGVDRFDYQRSNNVNRNLFAMNLA